MGTEVLEQTCVEHNIDPTGSHIPRAGDLIGTFFAETSSGLVAPRSVLFDLDPASIEHARAGSYGHLFPNAQCVAGRFGTGCNFGKGFYTEGAEIIDQLLDVVRLQIEQCESLQAFQLLFSLGGGTGSGAGSLLLSKLREELPEQLYVVCAVLPSTKVSDTVVEPYNAVLGLKQLTDNADVVLTVDNERAFDICHGSIAVPTYADLNSVISCCLASSTAPFRFSSPQFPHSWRQLAMSLVPFPRIHYLSVSEAPISPRNTTPLPLIEELPGQMHSPCNCITTSAAGLVFSSLSLYRGPYSDYTASPSADFIPDSGKIWRSPVPPEGKKAGGTLIANSTAVQVTLQRLFTAFNRLFSRRSFLNRWAGEGLSELELIEAEYSLNELISEYQLYDCTPTS